MLSFFQSFHLFCLEAVQCEEQKGWSLSAPFSSRLLAAMLKKVEMIRSDRLSVHWKMGIRFGLVLGLGMDD